MILLLKKKENQNQTLCIAIHLHQFKNIKCKRNRVAEIRFLLWGSCLVYDSFCRKGFVTCPESNTSAVTLVCISEKIYRYKIPLQSYTDSFSENYAKIMP